MHRPHRVGRQRPVKAEPLVHLPGAAPESVERRLHARQDAVLDQPGDHRTVDDLDVLHAVPAGPQRFDADDRGRRLEPGEHGGDGLVADRVEAALHAVPGAVDQVLADLFGGHEPVPAAAAGIVEVRLTQGGLRSERAVGVKVAAGADRTEVAGLGRAHQLAPVPVDLRQRVGRPASVSNPAKSDSLDVPGPPHSCTAAMPRPAVRRAATWAS